MKPDMRWLLAGALAVIVAVSLTLGHPRGRSLSLGAPFPAHSEAAPLSAPDTLDLESRWIGRGVVVKHHRDDVRTRLFAHRDAEGAWTNAAEQGDSSDPTRSAP